MRFIERERPIPNMHLDHVRAMKPPGRSSAAPINDPFISIAKMSNSVDTDAANQVMQ
jgi:hypothetical protein